MHFCLLNFKVMKSKLILISLIFLFSCKTETKKNEIKKEETSELKHSDNKLKVLNYDELKPLLEKQDGKIHVVNFWATWCKPCVEELPAFLKLNEEFKDKNVEMLFVSLDFPNEIESKLIPFIKERNLKPEVVVLDDLNQDKWINGISKDWTGSIPSTLIYKNGKRKFFEQSFTYDLLTDELKQFLN